MGATLAKGKVIEENKIENEKTPSTPPQAKVLRFDPRSPTDDINRTPIVVSDNPVACSDTPSSDFKVLACDPRSPMATVNRTPIVIQTSKTAGDSQESCTSSSDVQQSKPESRKPLANICTSAPAASSSECTDPRSPTVTVPRTPLQSRTFEVEGSAECVERRLLFNDSKDSDQLNTSREDETEMMTISGAPMPEESSRSNRTPLSNASNNRRDNPRGLLQAKQCKTLEEEFSKTQQNILSQIVEPTQQENLAPVPTSTQFVEQI